MRRRLVHARRRIDRPFACAALIVVGTAAPAWGQEAAASGSAAAPAVQAASDAPAADIVVTAQRRSESVQRAPLAIQALSGGQLAAQGITDVGSLQNGVPGFHVTQAGVLPQLAIRGVGSNQMSALGEPDISYAIDDVYAGKGSALNGGFLDVARVEVLKGPQGTLYGRNAVGGAINVITNDPNFDPYAAVELEAGSYGLFQGHAIVNQPLSDTVAVRAAVQAIRRNGYLTSGYNDADNISARLKLLWEPNDRVTIHLTGDYFHQGGRGGADVIKPVVNPDNPWQQANSVYTGTDGYNNNRNWSVSGRLDWDLGGATATIIPAYRSTRTDLRTYGVGQANLLQIDGRQTTLEARLASSNSSRFKWLIGGFALWDDSPAHQLYQKSSTAPYYSTQAVDFSRNATTSLAAFAQATYAITETIRATAGVRETYDRKRIVGASNIATITTPTLPPVPTSSTPLQGSVSYDQFNWKLGLDADLGPHSLVYFNVSTGYKSGGFYVAAPPNSFGPEKITAYSLGSKNRFFDNRLLLNVELFNWIYRDKQVSTFITVPPPVNVQYATINAGRARIRGVDVEAALDITAHDRLSGSVEYLDARFTSFELAATPSSAARNLTGYRLPNASKWSGNVAFQHDQPLGSGAVISARVESQIVSGQWLDLGYLPVQYQGGYTKTDASLRYTAPGKHWYVEVYGRNLENSAVFSSAYSSGKPFIFGTIEPPRTWGVKGGLEF